MLLSNFKTLFEFDIADYFDDAYRNIIRKIKLHPVVLPLLLGKLSKFRDMEVVGCISSSGSEIAFKELINPINAKWLSTKPDVTGYDVTQIQVGNPEITDYGFSSLDTVNESHTKKVEIWYSEDTLILKDLDEAFTLMGCYIYPYPILRRHPLSDIISPYVSKHIYDYKAMVALYDEETLYVDNSLAYLISLQLQSDYMLRCDNVMEASSIDNMLVEFINFYNSNVSSVVTNKPSVLVNPMKGFEL